MIDILRAMFDMLRSTLDMLRGALDIFRTTRDILEASVDAQDSTRGSATPGHAVLSEDEAVLHASSKAKLRNLSLPLFSSDIQTDTAKLI